MARAHESDWPIPSGEIHAGSHATTGWYIGAVAIGTGLLVFAVGTRLESLIIAVVGATGHELEWISDVVAAIGVSTVMYLWLHLRVSETHVLRLERARIAVDEQLKLAAEIQQGLLPPIPAETPGYLWAARMEAAHRVGGDFYDFVVRDDGSVLLVLGDVSGKGVPAALLQSSLQALFRAHASLAAEPDVIAARMSEGLREQTRGLPYATAIVARIEHRPLRITYVNAGHPAGLVIRGTEVLQLDVGGPPLGLLLGAVYERRAIDLTEGDIGVLVTDGITEPLDDADLCLKDTIATTIARRTTTPSDVVRTLMRIAAEASAHGRGTEDDRTVLAFRVRGLR